MLILILRKRPPMPDSCCEIPLHLEIGLYNVVFPIFWNLKDTGGIGVSLAGLPPKKSELFLFGLFEVCKFNRIFAREAGRAKALIAV